MSETTRLLVVAGEASGDAHAAVVLRALRDQLPSVEARGMGGPLLAAEGARLDVDLRRSSAMGGVEVAPRLPAIASAFLRLRRLVRAFEPHAALLVDLPDFNIPLARWLDRRRTRVVGLVAPQLWAWRPGRAAALARRFDAVACVLPFEEALLRARSVPATFVGHPLLDEAFPSRDEARAALGLPGDRRCVALLPGSRRSEVSRLLAPMLEGARRLGQAGAIEAVVAVAPSLPRPSVPSWARTVAYAEAPAPGRSPRPGRLALAAADVAVVASGTASLEAALMGIPQVVVYRMAASSYVLARAVVRGRFFALPNVLLGRRAVPELLQGQVSADAVGHYLGALAVEGSPRSEQQALAAQLRHLLGGAGAGRRTAALLARSGKP